MKIVSITGYGYSGSSAVKDLLREYEDICFLGDRELQLFDPPDGIRDLESHINDELYYINNSIAIRRFLIFMRHNRFMNKKNEKTVEEYLNNFVEIQWRGRTGFEKGLVFGPSYGWWLIKRGLDEIYERLFHKYSNILNTDFYITSPNNHFEEITKNFIDKFIKVSGGEGEIVAVDQLFPAIAPEKYFKYVNDPYCIVVDRDPRDIYLEAKKKNVNLIPLESAEDFVKYYKLTRGKKINSSRVLYIQFEDLIYHGETTKRTIENFLGAKCHINQGRYFKPDVSIHNTRLYLQPGEYAGEIEYIEKNLFEALYNSNKT